MAQAIPVALGAIQIGKSLIGDGKLKKEAAKLEKNRPIKTTSQFDRDATSLAESDLANGMSAEAEQAYNDAVDRGLSTSISALLKGGGSVNNIGEIYGNSEQGRQQLAIMEDQMRLAKINNVLKNYASRSDDEEKNWLVNEYGPYKDKLQAIGQQRQASANSFNAGINTIGSGVMNLLGGGAEKNMFNNNNRDNGFGNNSSQGSANRGYNTVQGGVMGGDANSQYIQPTSRQQESQGDIWDQPIDDSAFSNFWNVFKMKI